MEQTKLMEEIPPCPLNLSNVRIEYVTSDKAREYLANQRPNRKVKKEKINQYKRDMLNGKWKPNYVPLLFDKHGRMADGQHRCIAICESGMGQWFLIISGLDDSVFNTIDIGSVRTPGDIFSFNGVANSTQKACMVRTSLGFISESPNAAANKTGNAAKCVSPDELLDIYEKDKDSYDNALAIGRSCFAKRRFFSATFIAALVYFLIREKKHPQNVVELFLKMLYWQEDVELMVIKRLHEILLNDLLNPNVKSKLANKYKTMLLVKTWNAYVTKKDIQQLKWSEKLEKPIWFY